jgi:catechol 2,3-dioxygenase-like lactoylglutathione lyase family enzyme
MFEFDHVHIICTRMPEMDQFLTGVLGAVPTAKRDTRGFRNWEYRLGQTAIFLGEQQPGQELGSGTTRRVGVDHIGFRVGDIASAIERLTSAGCTLEEGPVIWRPDLTYAYLRGPESLFIELLERH